MGNDESVLGGLKQVVYNVFADAGGQGEHMVAGDGAG